jgi:hypothetical protein
MLREFAFSPDILLASAYGLTTADGVFHTAEDHGHLALNTLRKGLERGGVVRDLAGGAWLQAVMSTTEGLHPRSREVLLKIQKNGRVVPAARRVAAQPADEMSWLTEAFASHQAEPLLSQFFGTDSFGAAVSAAAYQQLPKGISKLPFCEPFAGGGCSAKVRRTLVDYVNLLRPLFKHSRSLMFIDPYLDLEAPNYRDFVGLLQEVARVRPDASVELHRQLRVTGPGSQLIPADEWRRRFKRAIDADPLLRTLAIEVLIWDEFHDRYLVSNLMGISVPYGFDTSTKADETRWTVLTPDDTDDIRVEFSAGDPRKRRRLQV